MKRTLARSCVTPLAFSLAGILICTPASGDVSDNFDSGTDAGWTHFEPLAPFGAPGSFTFPNGGYRIQAGASPDPLTLGAARAGSLRLDQDYANFYETYALVGWNNSVGQSMGVLGRASTPGFGTTRGYAFTYSTAGSVSISLLNNEKITALASAPAALDPTKTYVFEFEAIGTVLTGSVYDPVNHDHLVAAVGVVDASYSQGVGGFYLFSDLGNGTADATFDNYRSLALVPEPSTLSLLALAGAGLAGLSIWTSKSGQPLRSGDK